MPKYGLMCFGKRGVDGIGKHGSGRVMKELRACVNLQRAEDPAALMQEYSSALVPPSSSSFSSLAADPQDILYL